ncbi:MAG: hypothetical protein V4695_01300 [Pseudomonadota bacterium]
MRPQFNNNLASTNTAAAQNDDQTVATSTNSNTLPSGKKSSLPAIDPFGGNLSPLKRSRPATKYIAENDVVVISSTPPAVGATQLVQLHQDVEQQLGKLRIARDALFSAPREESSELPPLAIFNAQLIDGLYKEVTHFKNRLPAKDASSASGILQTSPFVLYGSHDHIEVAGMSMDAARRVCDDLSKRVNGFLPPA